ncbi:MAG: LCP family protein [Clostridiaceae bacterium]
MKQSSRSGITDRKRLWRRILTRGTILLLCAVAVYGAGRLIDSSARQAEPRGDLASRFTQVPALEHKGEFYRPKAQLRCYLIMGTDHYSSAAESEGAFRNGGQADYLLLIAVDDAAKTVQPIQIDRDTMTEITTLGVLGDETGTRSAQICLAHGFGDGGEQSCLLQKEAVSRLCLGVEIPSYAAMSMDGISVLNDAAGGIAVTLKDDFTSLDPSMTTGTTLTLQGEQAEYYVRNRMNIGIGTSEARNARQQDYWQKLSEKIAQILDAEGSSAFLNELYTALEPYLTTNLSRGALINETWKTKDYARLPILVPAGTYMVGGDGFMEFHIDEAALEQNILSVFYDKVP